MAKGLDPEGKNQSQLGEDQEEQVVAIDLIGVNGSALKFEGVNCAKNTAHLWGRRIVQCSISQNNMFALTDLGDIYCWGATSGGTRLSPTRTGRTTGAATRPSARST